MKKLTNPFVLSVLLLFGPFVAMYSLAIVLGVIYTATGQDTTGIGALSFLLIPIYMVTLPLSIVCFVYGLTKWFLGKSR